MINRMDLIIAVSIIVYSLVRIRIYLEKIIELLDARKGWKSL